MFLKPQSKRAKAISNLSIACLVAGIWHAMALVKSLNSGWDSKT
jgi:hypothetical protein